MKSNIVEIIRNGYVIPSYDKSNLVREKTGNFKYVENPEYLTEDTFYHIYITSNEFCEINDLIMNENRGIVKLDKSTFGEKIIASSNLFWCLDASTSDLLEYEKNPVNIKSKIYPISKKFVEKFVEKFTNFNPIENFKVSIKIEVKENEPNEIKDIILK